MKSQDAFHADGQLLLFPRLLRWPDDAFSVIDHPAPGLARVMVAPLFNAKKVRQPEDKLRCFAVSADRQFAALVTVSVGDLSDLDATSVWHRICAEVEIERASMREMSSDWSMQTPVDCLAGWRDPKAWPERTATDPIHPVARTGIKRIREGATLRAQELIDAEADAQLHVERLIKEGVDQVTRAMDSELASLLFMRPNLPVAVVHTLRNLARQSYDHAALRFVMQALKTEAISLLDLARAAPVDAVGKAVFETICKGFSLPRTLQSMGISKAAHRRTIRCAKLGATHTGATEFSEFPLSGRCWNITMGLAKRLPFGRWPKGGAQWGEFVAVAKSIHDLPLGHEILARLLRWCASSHYADCSLRLVLLLKQARALAAAAHQLGGVELNSEAALSIALNMAPINERRSNPLKQVERTLDTREVGRTVVELSRFTGLDLEEWVTELFKIHPGMPPTFQACRHIDVQPLTTFRQLVDHGCDSGTCLQNGAIAIQYAACGVALYAARDAGGELIGTFGLRMKGNQSPPVVNVTQVTGLFNDPAPPSLYGCATRLAKSFSAESLSGWQMFAEQVKKFHHAAGAS